VSKCKLFASVLCSTINRFKGLADTPSIDAVRAKIKGAKTPSPKVAPMMIKTGLITTLDHITGDTSKNDMATTWVHEMGHALSECGTIPAYPISSVANSR